MDIFTVKDLPGEEWKYIEGFPYYMVSNKGRVKRVVYEKFYHTNKSLRFYPEMLIKQQLNNGYYVVTLIGTHGRKELRVNRLVAKAFIENPDNLPLVNHLSEVKTDNNVENLEWATGKSNADWGTRNDRISRNSKGKQFTDEHRNNLSKAMKGNKNGLGRKNSPEHKEALAKAQSIPVVTNDMCFNNIKAAAEYYDVRYETFARWLRGARRMPEKFRKIALRYKKKDEENG